MTCDYGSSRSASAEYLKDHKIEFLANTEIKIVSTAAMSDTGHNSYCPNHHHSHLGLPDKGPSIKRLKGV